MLPAECGMMVRREFRWARGMKLPCGVSLCETTFRWWPRLKPLGASPSRRHAIRMRCSRQRLLKPRGSLFRPLTARPSSPPAAELSFGR